VSGDVRAAAKNNAQWCDAVCRSHGLPTRFQGEMWVAPEGSPPFYPDAITLGPGVSGSDVVACLPVQAESVKDSFGRLDLLPDGFRVLFDAYWIAKDAGRSAAPALAWTAVESPPGLADWTTAAGLAGIIRPPVLADPAVRIFAARYNARGAIVAGAIANATGRVVGVSNVFCAPLDAATVWHDIPAVLAAAFPARRIVGYERGDPLAHALDSGFSRLHPLRVWHREPA